MKRCPKCGETSPLENFSKNKNTKDGLQCYCKPCTVKNACAWSKENPEKARARAARWKLANRNVTNERERAKYAANPEAKLLANKEWREANPDKMKQYVADWAEKNPEKRKQIEKKWVSLNRGKVNAKSSRRNLAKMKRTPAWLTEEEIKNIQLVYVIARALTESTGIPHHVDHELPLRGKYVSGLHVLSNLQILTGEENIRKNNIWYPT